MIGLQASSQEVDIKKCLDYELAPVPTSMFTDEGEMRIAKSKSTLKTNLQVEVSESVSQSHDAVFLDGSALLWTVSWPQNGKVEDFIKNFKNKISFHLKYQDVYLVFDK